MKIYNILWLSAFAVGISSCSSDDNATDNSATADMTPISLQASSVETRASYSTGAIETETAMRAGSFGAVGYRYSDNAIYFGAASKGISHSYQNNGWGYTNLDEKKYWNDNTINFYAYFPYDITTTTFASSDASGDVMTLSGWPDGADVMYARELSQTKATATPMTFHHAFTKIDKIHITVPESSPFTFYIGGVEIMNTHTETGGKVVLGTSGEATCTNGAEARTRKTTFSAAKTVSKANTGGIDIITSDDNFFFFPVTQTSSIWDGTTTETGVCTKNLTVHLIAKVKQGNNEDVLKGEYVLGTDNNYADIYLPVKSSSNTGQTFERGKKYTINYTLSQGVGYDKDGKSYKPIALDVTVDDWTDNVVSVGQITVNNAEVTMASSATSDNSVVINASDASKLSATVQEGTGLVTAEIKQDTDTLKKIRLVITRNGTSTGTAKILINDTSTNSMVTITVTLQ